MADLGYCRALFVVCRKRRRGIASDSERQVVALRRGVQHVTRWGRSTKKMSLRVQFVEAHLCGFVQQYILGAW